MNRTFTLTALAATTLALGACSRDDSDAGNPFLAYVPADTAYVMANLEPTPTDVTDAWLARTQPILDELQSGLEMARNDVESGNVDIESSELQAVLKAVLEELDGKLNRDGLASLGLSLQQHSALYADGLLPVVRMGLGDAESLRAAIGRIEANSGVPIPEREHDGQAYWRAGIEEIGFAAYIAILDDHIAFGMAPTAGEDAYLTTLLGRTKPAQSLADSHALSALNKAKDYTAYGSGYLDVSRVVDELFSADSATTALLQQLGQPGLAGLDPACEREARLVSHFVPRLVAGTTELTADSIGMRSQVEMEPGLAGQLAALLADVPPASDDDSLLGSVSLNLSLGRLKEWLLSTTDVLAANPFECPQLAQYNDTIAGLSAQANQPMPPFAGNFNGFRAQLSSADLDSLDYSTMKGLFSVEMESPQMAIGMAQMMLPGLENLNIEPGADPVEVPQELASLVTPDYSVFAMMSSDAIGLSFGENQQSQLKPFLEDKQDSRGVLFAAEYDMAALAKLQEQAIFAAASTGDPAEKDAVFNMARAYQAMLGRNRVEFVLDGEGLTMNQRQTYR